MDNLIIRKYNEADRERIRNICKDTANKKYNKVESDRENICYMFIDYYLDFEPENVFVADDNGKACGYIVCSTNAEKYNKKMKEIYLKKIFNNSFIMGIFTKICLKTSNKLNLLYNGGFHINVDEQHQGLSLGPKLLTTLGAYLKSHGYQYMYLVTENKKTRGYSFYKHFGFVEVKKYFGGSLALIFDLNNIDEKIKKYDVEIIK